MHHETITINLSEGMALDLSRDGRYVRAALIRASGFPAMLVSSTSDRDRVAIAPPEGDGLALFVIGDAIHSVPAEEHERIAAFLASVGEAA